MNEPPFDDQTARQAGEPTPKPRLWIAPTVFLLVIAIGVLVLIFSNAESTDIDYAWFHGRAPQWLILAITFVAGAIVTRLFGWAWRSMRRRRNP